MKLIKCAASIAIVLLAACGPAAAQWQVQSHGVPIGQGAGITGFGVAAPGAAGLALVSNGPTLDPSFQAVPFVIGTTPVSGGTNNCLLYNLSGTVGCITTANNSVLATNGSGAPGYTQTMPSGITYVNGVLSGTFTGSPAYTGLHTFGGAGGIAVTATPTIVGTTYGYFDPTTLTQGVFSATAAAATHSEANIVLNMVSNKGAGNVAYYKANILSSVEAQIGSAPVWAGALVTTLDASLGNVSGTVLELDLNNNNKAYTPAMAATNVSASNITLTGTHCTGCYSTAAIAIVNGQSTTDPMWDSGILFGITGFNNFHTATIQDVGNSPTSILITGTHSANIIDISGATTSGYEIKGTGFLVDSLGDVDIGVSGSSTGILRILGGTSGLAILTAQDAAGTPTVKLPNASGTIAVSASAPLVLDAVTGNLTLTGGVASLGNATADTTLTLAGTGAGPYTGTVTAKLNLGNANTWSGQQTFVAPVLGTPASGTLTNTTGFPVANLAGAGTGVLTALAVNVGTAGSPVINGGALGTPSSGTLTNATGLPIAGTTGWGTGVATALGTAVNTTGGPMTFGTLGNSVTSTVLVGSAVAISNGVVKDITSISLPAGTWIVRGTVVSHPAGTTTTQGIIGWISTTSATLPTNPNNGAVVQVNYPVPAGADTATPTGSILLVLGSTTTVYLSVDLFFSISTMSAYGFIGATRLI